MINEPAQKAAIFFRQGQEDLIISPSYSGAPSGFAWLVPVPARPQVQIVEGALFHELAAATVSKPEDLPRDAMKSAVAERAAGVTLLERETVGAYDVSVLSSTGAEALVDWLTANGYALPRSAEGPAERYVREGWTFVACRIQTPANAASGLASGTLAPLRLTFPTVRPVYPMRLSAANPEPFTVLIYLLLPASETGGRLRSVPLADAPALRSGQSTVLKASVDAQQTQYPTLGRLTTEEISIYQEYLRMAPGDATRDFVWAPGHVSALWMVLIVPAAVIGAALAWALVGWRYRLVARARPL